jgi:PKD repeat protein
MLLNVGSSGSGIQSAHAIYRQTGQGIEGLELLTCGGSWVSHQFTAERGTTLYVQLGGWFAQTGSVTLDVGFVPPPPNDDFADALVIPSLPFADDGREMTPATVEVGEPASSCVAPPSEKTMWYAFTPEESMSLTASFLGSVFATGIVAYTGDSLGTLTEVACEVPGDGFTPVLTFPVDAGSTYYLQVGAPGSQNEILFFQLMETPVPVADWVTGPSDPSTFDVVQFFSFSHDPGGVGITSESWDFGDGATAEGCCPQHSYPAEGDYDVTLEVTTGDGRSTAVTKTLHVETHDVAIRKVTVPSSARPGQTKSITVGLTNTRHPETVQVELLRSEAGGLWQPVGVVTLPVPVQGKNKTTNVNFNYTFTQADALLGKVSFQAIVNTLGTRDAIPADNMITSLPTTVKP